MSTENLTLLKELAQDQGALEREDGEHEDHELEDLLRFRGIQIPDSLPFAQFLQKLDAIELSSHRLVRSHSKPSVNADTHGLWTIKDDYTKHKKQYGDENYRFLCKIWTERWNKLCNERESFPI